MSGAQPFAACKARHHSCISSAASSPSLVPLCVSSSSSGARGEALVLHARGRGSEGFETYDLSGRGRQQGRAGRSSSPRGSSGGRGGQSQGRSSSPRGGSGGRGRQGRGSFSSGSSSGSSIPLLEDCLAQAQQLHTGSSAADIASTVYILGKRIDIDTNKGQRPHTVTSSQRDAAVSATRQMVAALLRSSPSLPSPAPLAMQLGSKDLSLVSWAVSVLVMFDERVMSAQVEELYFLLAQRVLQPKVMEGSPKEMYDWALLLLSIGKVGDRWTVVARDQSVKEVFAFAIEQRLPDLLTSTDKTCVPQDISNIALACVYVGYKGNMVPFVCAVASRTGLPDRDVMADAEPQNWSNLIYACGKLVDLKGGKGTALGKGVSVIMREGAAAMKRAVSGPVGSQVSVQALSNTLWGLAHFDWFDAGVIRVMANAFVARMSSSKPQEVANVLLALSSLGWYERAAYDELVSGLVNDTDTKPQEFSNAMYSCAVASHSGPAVDALAHEVSKKDLSNWNEQAICNTLYAWAALSVFGMVSDNLNEMACVLFSEANDRGLAAFSNALEMTQLYMAHSEAVRVGLPGNGLSTANGLQQAAAEQHKQGQAKVAERSRASADLKQAMAALQQAGYEVQLGGRVGKDGHAVDLLVQHNSCPGGLAIDVVDGDDFFHHPQGQLNGKVAAVHAQIRQRCAGLVVLGEWEVEQPGVVVQRVQLELENASRQGLAESSSSSSTNTASTTYTPQPAAPPSHVASQAPPGLLQPKVRPPPSPGPRSAAASPPQLKGKPQRKQ